MKKFLPVLFILFSFGAFAQEPTMLWLKGYGGNKTDNIAPQVTKTKDGGFIISIGSNSDAGTGSIDSLCSYGGDRGIFIKYNSDATIMEWNKCYSFTGDTGFGYMFLQDDGSTVFGGEYTTSSGAGYYITRHDALDHIMWSKGYSRGNSPSLYDMIVTTDGGYIMVGDVYFTDTNFTMHGSTFDNADIAVLKLDSMGNKQWSRAIGGSGDDNGVKVLETQGGYYVVGYTSSDDGDCTGKHLNYDAYLVKLDMLGNIKWHHDLGGDSSDGGVSALADGNGGLIIAASSKSSDGDVLHHINEGESNIWVVDVDSSNNIVWSNCYGGGGGEYPNTMCMATDGSIWIAGASYIKGGEVDTSYTHRDAWIIHTDSIGNFLSAKVLGSNQQDEGRMIYGLSNGNIIAGGYYAGSNGSFSALQYYDSVNTCDAFLTIFSPQLVTGITSVTASNATEVYPNPARSEVNINAAGSAGESYKIIISNMLGQQIYEHTHVGAGAEHISTRQWEPGAYCVKIIWDSGGSSAQRLIVE